MPNSPLGWFGIARLGLVQASLGAIVVLTTTTLNRVMVVELALPAVVPGALVAAHYAVQMLRPRWGYGADGSGRRTPWILGGLLVLAGGAHRWRRSRSPRCRRRGRSASPWRSRPSCSSGRVSGPPERRC